MYLIHLDKYRSSETNTPDKVDFFPYKDCTLEVGLREQHNRHLQTQMIFFITSLIPRIPGLA